MYEKNKQYTARDVKKDDRPRKIQHINGQPVNKILHARDNNILQDISILWDDVGMAEDIHEPSAPHLQGKKTHHNMQNVEPTIIPNVPQEIHDRYKKITLCCDLMPTNVIGFLNTI